MGKYTCFRKRRIDDSATKRMFLLILCVSVVGYLCNTILNDTISHLYSDSFFTGSVQLKRHLSLRQLPDIKDTQGRNLLAFGTKSSDTITIPGIPKSVIAPANTTCDTNLDLLVYVHSKWSNSIKRRYIRNTWGGKHALLNYNVRIVFVLGKPEHSEDQVKINNEQLFHGDILEADVTDSFQNISLKCLAALNWIANICPSAKFILKVDDDMYVNPFTIYDRVLNVINSEANLILCHVIEEGTSLF